MMKELCFGFNDPLNCLDTDSQTYGCRANNPNICGNNSIIGICAYTSDDCICRKPSRAWKKQFYVLLGETHETK